MEQGNKFDQGKLRYDLFPPDALEEIVKVYTFGANKYGDRNWEKGLLYSREYAAVWRHIQPWYRRVEDYDNESGIHHLAHAAWNVLALLSYELRGMRKFDDRPAGEELVFFKLYPPPSRYKDMDLSSFCGKTEMESALKRIIHLSVENNDNWETPVNIFTFDKDEDEMHGFTYLLAYGWMEDDGSGNNFVLVKDVLNRLEGRFKQKGGELMLILIVGAPFTGKTVSACTFPKPLTYVELDTGGFESVKHAKGSDGKLIIPDWKDITVKHLHYKEAYDLDFKTAEKDDFKSGIAPAHTKRSAELMKEFNGVMKELFEKPPTTLVIDSATTLFRTWKDAILFTNRIPALRIADYGTLEGILFRQFIPTLKSLSADKIKWVIVIDHETSDKDEVTGILTEFPVGPSNNMGRALAKEFDEVWRQQAVTDGYQWKTRKHGLFSGAGSRLSLPDPIKPATFSELQKHLKV